MNVLELEDVSIIRIQRSSEAIPVFAVLKEGLLP